MFRSAFRVRVVSRTEALLVNYVACDREILSNEESLLDGGRSRGAILRLCLIDHVKIGLHVAHLFLVLPSQAYSFRIDLHLNLGLSLTFSLLTAIDLMVHIEKGT